MKEPLMEDWSARRYLQFAEERTRPARDLLARVPPGGRHRLVDLGCGPGNSTELLADRFPDAAVIGVDTSDDMLAEARKRLPGVRFEKGDVALWRSPAPLDLIFANAVLQWVPDHIRLMARLTQQLAPGGCLAVQVPDNFDEPSHTLMQEIATRPQFREKLAGAAGARETIGAFVDYHVALAQQAAVDVWRTTYVHALSGPDAIVDWLGSTGLRPYLDPLDPQEKTAFLAAYRDAIAVAYPSLPDGRVLLPFPRLFIVATAPA
jgi:trans-aconitate 2-methyltransferase